MKSLFFALVTSALACMLVSGAVASPNPRQVCGTGSKVLSKSTIAHDGKEIQFVTKSCPVLANYTTPAVAEKRQSTQCANGGCTIICEDYGEQPFVSDCQVITNALESEYPAEFTVPAGTYAEWSHASCAYAFLNFDTQPYNVCYLEFGFNSINAADRCFGNWPAPSATPGAACASPGVPGNDWGIEVFFP